MPPRELHQNGRPPTRFSNKTGRIWRSTEAAQGYAEIVAGQIKLALNGNNPPRFARARLHLFFFVADRRRRDVLNYAAAFKKGIDVAVQQGIIVDDDWQHLEIGSVRMQAMKKGGEPRVEVLLEAIDAEVS